MTDTLHLTIYSDSLSEVKVDSADSVYYWRKKQYTKSGFYRDTTENHVIGGVCDSIYQLSLSIGNDVVITEVVTACDSFTWRGTKYETGGMKTDTLHRVIAGVSDSIFILNLTIHERVHESTRETKCDTFTWHGTRYTMTGDYYDNHYDGNGCYVTDTLHLTIYSDSLSEVKVDSADSSYTWRGKKYTKSGFYRDTTENHAVHGVCDSIYQLSLSIGNDVVITEVVTACDSFTWRGTKYMAGGMKTDTLKNEIGRAHV